VEQKTTVKNKAQDRAQNRKLITGHHAAPQKQQKHKSSKSSTHQLSRFHSDQLRYLMLLKYCLYI